MAASRTPLLFSVLLYSFSAAVMGEWTKACLVTVEVSKLRRRSGSWGGRHWYQWRLRTSAISVSGERPFQVIAMVEMYLLMISIVRIIHFDHKSSGQDYLGPPRLSVRLRSRPSVSHSAGCDHAMRSVAGRTICRKLNEGRRWARLKVS